MRTLFLWAIDKLLPEKMSRKLKLLRLIMISDCHFENYLRTFPDIITDEELVPLQRNLDEKSLKTIDRFLELQSYSVFIHNKLKINPFLIIDCGALESWDKDEVVRFKELGKNVSKKYPFMKEAIYECALEHGLKGLPTKVLEYIKNKDFIDAGAFEGESNLLLQEYSPRKVYSFEPSPSAASRFRRNLSRGKVNHAKYQLETIALGNENTMISFVDDGKSSSCRNVGGVQVKMMKLDDYQKENDLVVGFIKADVEGMGVRMLEGMPDTLRKFRPVLCLSIYHNKDEFINTKPLLENLKLNYHMKIICLNPEVAVREVCLLAIPEELV